MTDVNIVNVTPLTAHRCVWTYFIYRATPFLTGPRARWRAINLTTQMLCMLPFSDACYTRGSSTLNWIPCTRTPAARERLALFDGDWDRDQRSLQLRAGLADHQAGAAAHGGEDEVAAHHGRLAVVISLAWLRRL